MNLDSTHAEAGREWRVKPVAGTLCSHTEDDQLPFEAGGGSAAVEDAGKGDAMEGSFNAVVMNPQQASIRIRGGDESVPHLEFFRIFGWRRLHSKSGAKGLEAKCPIAFVCIDLREQQRARKTVPIRFEVDVSKGK